MKTKTGFLLALSLTACSSVPEKGTPEYIREQVYQCRVLCANAEVNIARIEGLDCVCSKPQTPVFYNPIVTGSNGANRSDSTHTVEYVNRTPSVLSVQNDLEPKNGAAQVIDAQGRAIFSQTKGN
jgi:hypothetical protein